MEVFAMVLRYPNTYTYRRIVRYGDCDASRNYYTPRAIDYAIEAVEGWYENVLGASWTDLNRQGELVFHFLHAGCEFLKTLTAGEMVQARVEIVGVENSSLMFRVSGNNDAGELCFRAHLRACFMEFKQFEPVPIPLKYREQIRNYQMYCREGDAADKNASFQTSAESLPLLSEQNSRGVPFILQRRVAYGECGLSGTIYSPRVFDYLLEAVGQWYEKFLGISWMEQNIRNRGQPFLKVTCDYLAPMVTGQLISTIVTVNRLGRTSIAYSATGCDEKGGLCFNAELTACYCIEEAGALKAMPFPDDMRKRISAYKEDCINHTPCPSLIKKR